MRRQKFILVIPLLFPLVSSGDVRINGPHSLLAQADRLAMLYNWPKAAPLYSQAESLFRQSGDEKNALTARLGYIWATADSGVSQSTKREVAEYLSVPFVNADARLRLRALVAKAVLDRNENERVARGPWKQILELATALGDKRWEARAKAETGQILYMDGNIKSAAAMLRDAIVSQYLRLDFGAAVQYTAMVGNGFVETGQPEAGLQYCNIILRTSYLIPDLGFPFLAYQGKARALLALHRDTEARAVLDVALRHARDEHNHFALAQLLIVAGTGAARSSPGRAIEELKEANEISEKNGFQHVYAWGAIELAGAYRNVGDLDAAERVASKTVEFMRDLEDVYHLPKDLGLLADLESKKGNFERADQLYGEATDVMNGLLVNVVRRQLKSSLIATLSDAYVGHFELAATKLSDVGKAYEIIEEARGRALADTLQGESESLSSSSDEISIDANQEITRIQLALMHESNPRARQSLLDQLFGAEQLLAPEPKVRSALNSTNDRKPVPLRTVQASLHGDEMLLEYVLGDSQSYCLRTTRTGAEILVLPAGRKTIEKLVDDYLATVRSRQTEVMAGKELFSLLLQPATSKDPKPRLTIVPDGKLHLVPFDGLVDQNGKYVLESHIVTYAPSATVLHLLRRSHSTDKLAMSFLGVGDVIYPRSKALTADASGMRTTKQNATADFFDLEGVSFPSCQGAARKS
jgi:tetratricopeptide (TPR) repeat protein